MALWIDRGRGSIKPRKSNVVETLTKICQPKMRRTNAAILRTTDNLSAELYIKNNPKNLRAWAATKADRPHREGFMGIPVIL
jgi:hypothetical protein